MDKFNQSGPLSLPKVDFKEARKETPQFQFQTLAFSLLFPLVLGIVGTILGLLFWVLLLHLNVRLIWIFTAAGVAIGVYEIIQNWDTLVFHVEVVTGRDWNNDNFLGQPPLKPQHYVIDALRDDEGGSYTRKGLDGPENPKVLMAWIDAGLRQQSLAIEKWEQPFGYVYPRGTKTSVYMLFKAGAVSKGLLIDRGSHGIMLSNEGRHEFRQMLEQMRQEELPALTDGEDDK